MKLSLTGGAYSLNRGVAIKGTSERGERTRDANPPMRRAHKQKRKAKVLHAVMRAQGAKWRIKGVYLRSKRLSDFYRGMVENE